MVPATEPAGAGLLYFGEWAPSSLPYFTCRRGVRFVALGLQALPAPDGWWPPGAGHPPAGCPALVMAGLLKSGCSCVGRLIRRRKKVRQVRAQLMSEDSPVHGPHHSRHAFCRHATSAHPLPDMRLLHCAANAASELGLTVSTDRYDLVQSLAASVGVGSGFHTLPFGKIVMPAIYNLSNRAVNTQCVKRHYNLGRKIRG